MKRMFLMLSAGLFIVSSLVGVDEVAKDRQIALMCNMNDRILESAQLPDEVEIEELAHNSFEVIHDTTALCMIFDYHTPIVQGVLKSLIMEFQRKFLSYCR